MTTLLILGGGGHGKVVADTALETGQWNDVVFLDDAWPNKIKNGIWDISGKIENLNFWAPKCKDAIVAIGNNQLRLNLQDKLIRHGFNVPIIIHPTAQVSRYAKLGLGCVVFSKAVINVDVEIGVAGIINTSATVDHDCKLGNGIHIAPGANLGGGISIGNYSMIGIGAAIRQYLTIGSNVTIGAGSVVVKNIENDIVAVGVPAVPIKKNKE